jgi:glycosidase
MARATYRKKKKYYKILRVGPHLHDYLQEMNKEVFSKYDIMTVAEGAGSTPEDAFLLLKRHEKRTKTPTTLLSRYCPSNQI